jgi:hypothetical protein
LKSILLALAVVPIATPFAFAEIRQPSGFYDMQALHQANVPDDVLSSPQLAGIHLRDPWQLLEPAPDVDSFS